MYSAPPQPREGEGESSATPAHPCLSREGSRVLISQAANPKEAAFIISAFWSHLQYVFPVVPQPPIPQCNYILRKVGQSWWKGGVSGAGSMWDTSWYPQKASNRKSYKKILAKAGFFHDELPLHIIYTAARSQSRAFKPLQLKSFQLTGIYPKNVTLFPGRIIPHYGAENEIKEHFQVAN